MNAPVLLLLVIVSLTLADSVLSDGTTYCANDGLNVREGPCTDRKILVTISQGTQAQATGKQTTACGYIWLQIQTQGKTGWAGKYIIAMLFFFFVSIQIFDTMRCTSQSWFSF